MLYICVVRLIDTHTHLYLEQFDEDRDTVVQSAIDKGVEKMLLPNIDAESIKAMHKLHVDFPENCLPMMPGPVELYWLSPPHQFDVSNPVKDAFIARSRAHPSIFSMRSRMVLDSGTT